MSSVQIEAAGIKVKAPIIVAIIASIGTIIVAGMSAFFQGATESQVDKLSVLPEEVKVLVEIKKISEQLSRVDKRLFDLERYLLASPDKALALPLISKEVENLSSSVKSERVNTQTEIARIYDQNKWFIGLMFTMAISVLGLAISNLFQGKKSNESAP
jgi:hypothetical protein